MARGVLSGAYALETATRSSLAAHEMAVGRTWWYGGSSAVRSCRSIMPSLDAESSTVPGGAADAGSQASPVHTSRCPASE